MSERTAMLVDYEYCVGCCDCELACMESHDHGPDRMGIKVQKLGPWSKPGGGWQYDFMPIPTDWCDSCQERVAKGSRPACVDGCTYNAIKVGPVEEMENYISIKGKQMMLIR